jgi:hypothetical protein
MNKILPIFILPILTLTSCNSGDEDKRNSRYSAQTFSVAAGTAVVTQITDHEANKIYYYKLSDEEGLVLKNTIDLTKCGDQIIPFEDLGGADEAKGSE